MFRPGMSPIFREGNLSYMIKTAYLIKLVKYIRLSITILKIKYFSMFVVILARVTYGQALKLS